MTLPNLYLLCFAVGSLWALASLLLGGLHLGHSGHVHLGHGHAGHLHGHALAKGDSAPQSGGQSWFGLMINPSCLAVYLAWFGGVGFLLTRHTGLVYWLNLLIAIAVGLTGASILGSFLHFLQSREKSLDPGDYEMVGILGQVSSSIRPGGVGEVIYLRDGARCPISASSEDGQLISRGEEVIVTRFEKGIAYVRTWEAMTQPGREFDPQSSAEERKYVQ